MERCCFNLHCHSVTLHWLLRFTLSAPPAHLHVLQLQSKPPTPLPPLGPPQTCPDPLLLQVDEAEQRGKAVILMNPVLKDIPSSAGIMGVRSPPPLPPPFFPLQTVFFLCFQHLLLSTLLPPCCDLLAVRGSLCAPTLPVPCTVYRQNRSWIAACVSPSPPSLFIIMARS